MRRLKCFHGLEYGFLDFGEVYRRDVEQWKRKVCNVMENEQSEAFTDSGK